MREGKDEYYYLDVVLRVEPDDSLEEGVFIVAAAYAMFVPLISHYFMFPPAPSPSHTSCDQKSVLFPVSDGHT